MTQANFIQTPQGRFHYYSLGKSDKPVFFCHGNSMSAGSYLPFLHKLADQGLQVFAPDLRGHGFSTKDKTQNIKNWDIFIKDVRAFLTAISNPMMHNRKSQITNRKFVGMGHSLGGFLVYATAALYPGLFSGIILLDPIILPPEIVLIIFLARKTGLAGKFRLSRMTRNKKFQFTSKKEALEHYSGKGMFKTWLPEFIEAYVETAIAQDFGKNTFSLCCHPEFEAMIYESLPLNIWNFAGQINVPVTIVRGGNSDMFVHKAEKRLSRMIKDCRFVTLEGLSHFMMMEDPDRVIAAIFSESDFCESPN
jgi:pimeloyl-ACP methyl ester carboxylesterase